MNTFRAQSRCIFIKIQAGDESRQIFTFWAISSCLFNRDFINLLRCVNHSNALTFSDRSLRLESLFYIITDDDCKTLSTLLDYFSRLRANDKNRRAKCHSHGLTAFTFVPAALFPIAGDARILISTSLLSSRSPSVAFHLPLLRFFLFILRVACHWRLSTNIASGGCSVLTPMGKSEWANKKRICLTRHRRAWKMLPL